MPTSRALQLALIQSKRDWLLPCCLPVRTESMPGKSRARVAPIGPRWRQDPHRVRTHVSRHAPLTRHPSAQAVGFRLALSRSRLVGSCGFLTWISRSIFLPGAFRFYTIAVESRDCQQLLGDDAALSALASRPAPDSP